MRIDLESRALQGATAFVLFIVLNVVFLVTCIPIVTIGAATSALFEVTMRYSDEEEGHLIGDYFRAFGRNAARATAVLGCTVPPAILLTFAGLFWMLQGGLFSILVTVIAWLAALYFVGAFFYGTALVARFHAPVRRTLKNSLLLPMAEPWRTFVLIVIPATAVCLTIIFPVFLFVLATVGFSVGTYATGFLLRGVFARHAPSDETSA